MLNFLENYSDYFHFCTKLLKDDCLIRLISSTPLNSQIVGGKWKEELSRWRKQHCQDLHLKGGENLMFW